MKMFKIIFYFLTGLFLLLPCLNSTLYAGTIHGGVNIFYATWDSAASQLFEDMLDDVIEKEVEPIAGNINYSLSYEDGKGFLGGFVLGYETDNKKWIFDAKFMLFNSFSQKADISTRVLFFPVTLPADIELDRKEMGISACYVFNEYLNVFLGYKYETYNLKAEVNLDLLPPEFTKYEYEAKLHLLLPGVGATLPIDKNGNYKLGINLGTLAGMPKIEDKIRGEKIEIKGKYGLLGEIYGSARLGGQVSVKLGYSYETYKVSVNMKDRGIKKDVAETFHGVSIQGLFLY